jgi:hypothetical protein
MTVTLPPEPPGPAPGEPGHFTAHDWLTESIHLLAAADLPGRLRPNGVEVNDWNLALEVGFYRGLTTAANSPTGYTGSWFHGIVFAIDSGNLIQLVWNRDGSATTPPAWWIRRLTNGVFTQWWNVTPAVVGTVPYAVAAGISAAWSTINTGTGSTINYTFPAGRFTVPPALTVGVDSNGYLAASAGSVTATGFAARLFSPSGSNVANAKFHWTATQMLYNSGPGVALEAAGVTLLAVCRTIGCENYGVPIELVVDETDADAPVACGVCGLDAGEVA